MGQRDIMRNYFQLKAYQLIPVYELADISLQYNARIHELRKEGMNIIKVKDKFVGTKRHTAYMYCPEQTRLF